MEKSSLYRDLVRNPHESEDSRIVAAKWGATVDAYLPEIPDASSLQYFNLSAERLLYRSKILSLTIDQELAESESLQTARPFGKGGPTFSMLRDSSVRMAMAFVPLTPTGGNGKAILARLYCVTSLLDKNKPPFEKGVDSPNIDKYSWFVAGVPAVFEGEMLSGRSWLLAAHLLMQVVNAKDNATARNLATNFIITGDVESGSIKEVDMGQKPNLANIKEYRAYKWIIPMKNANEMTNVPSRKIEKPATLEEAYKLIETMQNKATRSFFRFLKKGNLDGMKEQYEIGADVYAQDDDLRLMPIEYIGGEIRNLQEALGGAPLAYKSHKKFGPLVKREDWNKRLALLNKLNDYNAIRIWLQGQGANCASTIYILAKSCTKNVLEDFISVYPINARDEYGLTAVDYALLAEDWATAQGLIALGGVCDKTGEKNTAIKTALREIVHCGGKFMTTSLWKCFDLAFSAGLHVDTPVHFVDAEETEDGLIHDVWRLQVPLIGLAIYDGNERLLKLCVEHGADVNKPIKVDLIDDGFSESPDNIVNGNDFKVVKTQYILPLAFGYFLDRVNDDINLLLKQMGAEETDDVVDARDKWKAEKEVIRHKKFRAALLKLSDEKNRKTVVECLNAGESVDVEIEGVIEEFCDGKKTKHQVRSSLYGMALSEGWLEIVAKCLDLGASPISKIDFISLDGPTTGAVYLSMSPIEIANAQLSSVMQTKLLNLLERRGSK